MKQSTLVLFITIWAMTGLALGIIANLLARRWRVKLPIHRSADFLQSGMFYGPFNVIAIYLVWADARDARVD